MAKRKRYWFIILTFLSLIACNNFGYLTAGKDPRGLSKYDFVKGWLKLPDRFKLGNPTGIGIDNNQNILVYHRADREWPLVGLMPVTKISSGTILTLDRDSGKILNSWGSGIFIMPHGLTVDINNNIWVTDVGLHQIFKFNHDGKLLMTLGEAKVSGNDSTHFNRPTDIAVAEDGSFYVSDGYGNSRIVKFSSTGHYLFEWGKKGNKAGEFNIPHAITLDDRDNVYVADRENNRIQVFNSRGKFMKQWTSKRLGRICSVVFDKHRKCVVAVDDATSWFELKHNGSDIIVLDTLGNLIDKFGKDIMQKDGIKCWYHDVVVDNQGSIYAEDILGNRIHKFRKVIKY